MGRSPCCNEAGLKKGAWTADEDQKLLAHIQKHGEGGWRTLPQKAGIQRCGKSCRLRWVNYLRPDIKRGEFGPDEEKRIVEFHATLGNKWSAIARQLPGRTDNEIKNYWNTHLKKRVAEQRKSNLVSNGQLAGPQPTSANNDSKNVAKLSHEAREGRSISSLARLLNKVATKLGPMQYNKMATNVSTEAKLLSAVRTVLLKSTSGNPGDGGRNDRDTCVNSSQPLSVFPDGPSEMLSRVSLSTPARIVNKMATKLASSSIDALKDRLGGFPDCMNTDRKDGDTTNYSSETKTCSYNNTESSISTSTVWKTNTPTSSVFDCESSDQLTGILSMCENEINEAFTALDEATVFDQPQGYSTMYAPAESGCESSEVRDILGTCEGEAGAAFTNVSQHMVFDSHGVTVMEAADNTCNDVMRGCRKLAFRGPNNQQYTKTLSNDSDRFGGDGDGDGETNSGASDYLLDCWDSEMHVEDYSWPQLQ